MILLSTTGSLLKLVTSAATAVDVHASFVDNSSGAITPGTLNTIINSATTTNIVASPGASTQRSIKHVSIMNTSATTANTVTVEHYDGTTLIELLTITLNPGQSLIYDEGDGWFVPNTGVNVSSLNGLTGGLTLVATDGDVLTLSGSKLLLGGPGGFVNKFRNAAMDHAQRGTSGTIAANSNGYTVDGWIVGQAVSSGSNTVAWTQASPTSTAGFPGHMLEVSGNTNVTDVFIRQRIEGSIVSGFNSEQVTVQAQIFNQTGATITPTLTVKHASTQDSWGAPVTDVSAVSLQPCPANAWTLVSYTFTAAGNSYLGLEVTFDFGAVGSGANVYLTAADIRVTPGIATGLNSNPPPPELRPIGIEIPFNLRYFYA